MGTEIKAAAIAATLESFARDAILKAHVLSGFTRQQLKPFLSVGKRQDVLTTGQVTPEESS